MHKQDIFWFSNLVDYPYKCQIVKDDKNNNEPNTTRSMAPDLFLKHNSKFI